MQTLFAVFQVALGLGFVIFVHELGHFAVAKWCGVRCDRFFVGFDVPVGNLLNDFLRMLLPGRFPEGGEVKPFGISLPRTIGPMVQVGETVYGIGVLPLGGYVKMYGQEDNAAAIAEEIEKSKAMEGSPDAKEITAPGGEKVWVDKRSYLAKTVPQRMAIISAGVIMNVIFAFIMAVVAFGVGVPETPAIVGGTTPGLPAWEAGLRTGDTLVRINDVEDPGYQELIEEVILGDSETGIRCLVQRADGTTSEVQIAPQHNGERLQIGMSPTMRPTLATKDAVRPNTPAAELGDTGFQDGDQIVDIDGVAITTYADLAAVLQARRADPLTYTVVRDGKTNPDDPFGAVVGGERVEFTVGPNPMERLGVVLTLGPVASIAEGSPAADAASSWVTDSSLWMAPGSAPLRRVRRCSTRWCCPRDSRRSLRKTRLRCCGCSAGKSNSISRSGRGP